MGVVLNVGGIGYEIQLLQKQINEANNYQHIEFWIHQIHREDQINLYGFREVNQRDLFREIISVNGIGPQIGMALLEDFEVNELVNAIETKESSELSRTQGIGKRTAERLIVELSSKLHKFVNHNKTISYNETDTGPYLFSEYIDEIHTTLKSLGYSDNEIKDSIKTIKINEENNSLLLDKLSSKAKAELMDKHLKEILIRLSEKTT